VKNQKYKRGGRLKFKTYILLYGDNSLTIAVGQMKFAYRKRSWTRLQVFFEPLFCFTKPLNVAMALNVEVIFEQTLNHPV
jgi:hypothetical protein